MSRSGRTTWWPKDAAWHRRERQIELGTEFGPGGVLALDVLCSLAQEQRDEGRVFSGFGLLAREAFLESAARAREIVEFAASIGALDDLELDEDGRRFRCRISGWSSDQRRGREALKKAGQRADAAAEADQEADQDDTGTCPDETGQEGDESRSVLLTDITRHNNNNNLLVGTSSDEATPVDPDEADQDEQKGIEPGPDARRLCTLLASLILERDPKAKVHPDSHRWLDTMRLLLKDRDGDTDEVERTLRWSQQDEFNRGVVLSPSALRRRYGELFQQSQRQPRPSTAHRSPGQQPTVLPAAHPCPGPAEAAAQTLWEQAEGALREALGDEQFDVWFGDAHPHDLAHSDAHATLVVGIKPEGVLWAVGRFGRLLQKVADTVGTRLQFVACAGHGEHAVAA